MTLFRRSRPGRLPIAPVSAVFVLVVVLVSGCASELLPRPSGIEDAPPAAVPAGIRPLTLEQAEDNPG